MGKRAGGGAHAAPLPDQEPLSPAPDEGIIPSFSGSLHRQGKCVCGRLSAPHHFPHQGLPLILGPLLSKATLGKDASVPPPFAPFFPTSGSTTARGPWRPRCWTAPSGSSTACCRARLFQIWDEDPACPLQMVGSTARGRRFSNFQAKLLAIGAALGFHQSQTSMDGFNEPMTALVSLQR